MKKYFFVFLLVCLSNNLFADTQTVETKDDVKKLYLKIDNLSEQKNYSEALKICNKIVSRFETRYKNKKDILSAVLLVRSYVVKSKVCYAMNDLAQSVDLMQKAVALYEKFSYLKQSKQYPKLKSLLQEREIILTNYMFENALDLLYQKGHPKQAKIQLLSTIRILEHHMPPNVYKLGLAYFCLWECQNTLEYREKAKKYLLRALTVKEYSDYINTKDPEVYSMLGKLCSLDKNYKASITHYHKFLKTSQKLKLDVNLSNTYRNLAIAYSKEEDYKNALIYIKKSLKEFPQSEDYGHQINRAGLSLFLIKFLFKNNKKEEAKIQINNLKEQISKIPKDYKYVKKILKQCDVFQKQLEE